MSDSYVKVDDMVWPSLFLGETEWRLRYADDLNKMDRLVAASAIAAYMDLVRKPIKERNRICAAIRKSAREQPVAQQDAEHYL